MEQWAFFFMFTGGGAARAGLYRLKIWGGSVFHLLVLRPRLVWDSLVILRPSPATCLGHAWLMVDPRNMGAVSGKMRWPPRHSLGTCMLSLCPHSIGKTLPSSISMEWGVAFCQGWRDRCSVINLIYQSMVRFRWKFLGKNIL